MAQVKRAECWLKSGGGRMYIGVGMNKSQAHADAMRVAEKALGRKVEKDEFTEVLHEFDGPAPQGSRR